MGVIDVSIETVIFTPKQFDIKFFCAQLGNNKKK